MIIQAGFDLQILARPLIVQQGRVLPRLVVIGLDAEMQLDGVEVVSDEFAGSLKPHHDAILDGLDPEWTKYFAIAHAGIWTEHNYHCDDPILLEAAELETVAAHRGFHMIGHFGQDETGYMSAGAHSYFDQYPRHVELPCTMTHWVNSKVSTCWRCCV
ncbi:hypothetical protein FCN77_24095 [Arthrobacter sp. 24S4-2]|uniref:hypothetical protein n=1 Tax=Arthrobacter sp. 24S4-2 TaxID=2575374 RepID=UPI0010C7D31B|nr:hypothetical protein [Arthrobacter sp. 24S4-2]QCP00229.1 hypothetical protein FCN77_24095 [Arthrobacter sp. 24S4-2]